MTPQRTLAIAIGLVALLAGGYAHGVYSGRWARPPELENALERLDRLPHQLGDWVGTDSTHIAEQDFRQTGALKHLVRMYQKPGTSPLEVIVMCGRPGRMSVHTPEVCYRGVGYELYQRPTKVSVPEGTLWSANFSKPGARGSDLTLLWSWNAGGKWTASDNPRWDFLGQPFLVKLYISQRRSNQAEQDRLERDEFLKVFLPAFGRTLFPPGG